MKPDRDFWDNKYTAEELGWDTGSITPPLKNYIDHLQSKDIEILIPGAGNSYEAEYLYKHGYSSVTVLDISSYPLKNLKQRVPGFPEERLVQGDFFQHSGQYDLILEQTFFCALHPSLRKEYARKMNELLNPGGKLAGVLFDAELNKDKPPFGGHKEEYIAYFEPYFEIHHLERCYNSIPPRQGNELFIELVKRT